MCHLPDVTALCFCYVWGASVKCRRLWRDVPLIGKDRMTDSRLAFCQSSGVSLRGEAALLSATHPCPCHARAFQPCQGQLATAIGALGAKANLLLISDRQVST